LRAVTATARRIQIADIGAHGIEQHPIAAGHDHHCGQDGQVPLQELDGVVVQVVGRLVQQQGPGLAQQQGG